jgi:hypothetical protein
VEALTKQNGVRLFGKLKKKLKKKVKTDLPYLACVAGGIRGHERMGSLKYRLPKNDTF